MFKLYKLILTVLFGMTASTAIGSDELDVHANDCGPNSIYIIARMLDYDINYDAIKRELPSRHAKGYSMAELQDAAKEFGLTLQGVRLSLNDMPLRGPTIAYFDGGEGHFVSLRPVGVTGKMVQVVDPPYAPTIVDYEQLFSSRGWTGKALIVRTLGDRVKTLLYIILIITCVALPILLFRRSVPALTIGGFRLPSRRRKAEIINASPVKCAPKTRPLGLVDRRCN